MKSLCLAWVCAVSFFFSSCENESSGVTAIVDGQLWESDSFARAIVSNSGKLIINAESRLFLPMAFSISAFNPSGQYAIDSLQNAYLFGKTIDQGYFAKPNRPGTFLVTEVVLPQGNTDGTIKASFDLTAFNLAGDSIRISEGRMDLTVVANP